jgi:hypothetical protein
MKLKEVLTKYTTCSDEQSPRGRALLVWFGIGILLVFLYEIPPIVQGENTVVMVHDDLDSTVGFYAFAHDPRANHELGTSPMLGGLPKAAYCQERDVMFLLYGLFSPFWAYRANVLLIRIIAFCSMFGLLYRLRSDFAWISFGVALAFSYLPFWTPGGATIAALPAVAVAVWICCSPNASFREDCFALGTMLLYPFYSLPYCTGIFIIPVVGLCFVIMLFRRPGRSLPILMALALLLAGYVVSNWGFIANQFAKDPIIWHREEFSSMNESVIFHLRRAMFILRAGHYTAWAKPFPFIWLAVLFCVALFGLRFMKGQSSGDKDKLLEERKEVGLAVAAVIFAVTAAVFYFVYFESTFLRLRERLPLMAVLNLSRVYFFLPLTWHVAFFCALRGIWRRKDLLRFLAVMFLMGQIAFTFYKADWYSLRHTYPTYSQYVSSDLFDAAEKLVGKDRQDFSIACLGFFPSVAHLNGFRTVDGYWPLYPLEYKHRFRPAISDEVAKSAELRDYFDKWGSRCYIMSAELGKHWYVRADDSIKSIRELNIDTAALRELGASHLFSSVLIENAKDIGLSFLGHLTDPRAAIELYIYSVTPVRAKE